MSTYCTSGGTYFDPEEMDICEDPSRLDSEKSCAGCGLSPDQMISYWTANNCQRTYSNVLFSSDETQQFQYNPQRLERVQTNVNATMSNYFSKYSLTDPSAGNPFQQTILNMCRDGTNLPGVCDNYLCNRLCGNYTYDQISNNPYLANWCGCYVPPPEQEVSVIDANLGTAVVTSCDSSQPASAVGNTPCYPLCHRIQTTQLYEASTGCQYSCNNTVCVIDDVSLNVAGGNVGGVNFTQMCPGCSPNQACECIISSSDLPEAFEEMGIDATFTQYCSPGVCYELDDAGRLNPIPCDNFYVGSGQTAFSTALPWIFFGLVIFIVLVIILAFAATRERRTIEKVPTTFSEPSTSGEKKYSWEVT